MAVATAIMAKMTTNSPRRKPQRPKAIWIVNSRTNSKKNAAGVAELSPRREPWMTHAAIGNADGNGQAQRGTDEDAPARNGGRRIVRGAGWWT